MAKLLIEETDLHKLIGAFNNLNLAASLVESAVTDVETWEAVKVQKQVRAKALKQFVEHMKNIHDANVQPKPRVGESFPDSPGKPGFGGIGHHDL